MVSHRHRDSAISRACEQLKLPHWTPHWLRYNVATRVRDEFGIEAAQAMAGHSSPLMTAHYARKMDGLAAKVAAKIGSPETVLKSAANDNTPTGRWTCN